MEYAGEVIGFVLGAVALVGLVVGCLAAFVGSGAPRRLRLLPGGKPRR